MNYNKKSVEDIDVRGKRVLCRCDFNVPTKGGVITSDKRIVAALPTIQYLVKHGARVILCSHMGKPKGEWKPRTAPIPRSRFRSSPTVFPSCWASPSRWQRTLWAKAPSLWPPL